MEIFVGDFFDIEFGEGIFDFGFVGNVIYQKVDWKFIDIFGINFDKEFVEGYKEMGKNQCVWVKVIVGFEFFGFVCFVIIDCFYGYIFFIVIGVLYVFMDSKFGKNFNFYNIWIWDCECICIIISIGDVFDVVKLYFDFVELDDVM